MKAYGGVEWLSIYNYVIPAAPSYLVHTGNSCKNINVIASFN
jgi:hypothetical protein